MSEEEIILDKIMMIDRWKTSGDIYTQDELNSIGELLDLYQKEKEKNKTLETLLQGNLYQMYLYYKELASRYQANNISKDKIREIIKDVDDFDIYFFDIKSFKLALKNSLEELLKEE